MADNVYAEALKNYGIVGFVVVATLLFAGWLILKIVYHFMDSSKSKDAQIIQISERFSSALEGNSRAMTSMGDKVNEAIERNTQAMNDLAKAEITLANATENVTKGFDRQAEQNRQEHGKILDFVQSNRARI